MQSIRSGAWVLLLLVACAAHGGVNSWSSRGPFGGPIFEIAIHPSQPNLAFATAAYSLYRTTDGGDTWNEVPQFFGIYGMGQVQFDPSNPGRLYVTSSRGLWRSTDGGITFTNISSLADDGNNVARGLAISADGNSIYYSTSGQRFFRSTDGGATFSERPPMPAYGPKLVVDPANASVVYAAEWNKLGKTTNGGDSWVELQLPMGATFANGFALIPGSPNVLWVSTPVGVHHSSDDGASWTGPVFTGYDLQSDPSVPGILYASPRNGIGPLRRYSAGSWTDIDTLPTLTFTVAISASNPQSVFAGSKSGLFRSSNGGTTWTRSDNGLDAIDMRQLATGGGRIYTSSNHVEIGIGDADEGTLQRSKVAGPTEPDLAITALGAHPTDPSIVLVGSYSGVHYSNDGGTSWNLGPANLAPTRIDALAFDPHDPQNIYLALYPQATSEAHIQRSTDGGATFTPVSVAGLTNIMATRLLVDPANSARLFLSSVNYGGNSGLFRSVDSGVTWNKVLTNDGTLDLAINPANSQRLYAISAGTLNVSDNGGDSFAPSTSFLTYGGPYAIELDPAMPDVVYVLSATFFPNTSSEYFVTRSVDAGSSWERIANATRLQWYPMKLAINAAAPTTLLAATATNGLLSFEVAPDLEVTVLDHSGNRGIGVPNHFGVRVHNNGPLAATGVTFDIQAPAGATDVSAQLPGGTCTTAATTVHCSLPFVKLAPDATARVTYTSPAAAQLSVQANVTARERDPVGGNNTAIASATATQLVDLIVTGSSSAAIVDTNSAFAFTFQVRNAGPNTSSSTRLSINVGAGAAITSVTPSQCSASGTTVTCDFGAKASGESASVTVNATASTAGTLSATASATHAADAAEADASNDSASVQVTSRTPSSGGGGGGGMSLYFMLCLALLALIAPPRRRVAR
jgi:hypothetical protein